MSIGHWTTTRVPNPTGNSVPTEKERERKPERAAVKTLVTHSVINSRVATVATRAKGSDDG